MSTSSVTGSVKFFNAAKGFGFIAPEDGGKDVFVPAASISASGLARLKAGQRVSFEMEPDAKGPKAVKLVLLEEAPAEIKPVIQQQAPLKQPATKKAIAVYSDSATANGALDDVLDALAAAGENPNLIEVGATSREDLKQLSLLLREADQSLVRRYDTLFLALQLDDRFISESDFWTAIVEHPSLINGPVVATTGKARICKTEADVKAFLGADSEPDGGSKPKGISPRMAALMRGESLPPRAPSPPPPEPKPAAEPSAKTVEAKAPAPTSAKAKPAATPVKKTAAKVAKAAPAKAKKK